MITLYEKFLHTSGITATAVPTRCNEALFCFIINQQYARSKIKWNTNHKTHFILSDST